MSPRLPREAVLRHLTRLADDLTPRQTQRLRALADLIDGDGRIPMAEALAAATPGGDDSKAQDAFRKFRAAFDDVAEAANVKVRLVSDQHKAPPRDRFCWFEGEDLAGDELADRSRREADRSRREGDGRAGERTVTATVTEVLPMASANDRADGDGDGDGDREIVIHVEIARKASEPIRRLERKVVELLREQASAGPGYRVTSVLDPLLGVDVESERRRLREAADLVVELDSAAASADVYPGATARRPLRLALEEVARAGGPRGGGPRGGGARLAWQRNEIVHEASRPFSQHLTRNLQVAFVGRTLSLIAERLLEPTAAAATPARPRQPDGFGPAGFTADGFEPASWVRHEAGRRLLRETPVDSEVDEILLASDALERPAARRLSEPLPAVERLVTWASEPSANARHLCALLGDVGTGKTTTVQLFTLALLDRREHDPSVPLPILFDLRDLRPSVVRESTGFKKILQALLDAGDVGRAPTVQAVLELVAGGTCVLIFDGLDEVLVHLEPHAGQVFTRTLWRAAEDLWRAQPADARADRPSKLLLSCRTHYFRSIRDETNHLTGQHREGPVGSDYLALLMLPFGEAQIRAYLAANVEGADVDRLLELIGSVHNLREIAERPLTLRMVASQLELVEQARLAGRTVHAVDLYASFVRQWLERDDGKHSLLPEHKQLLMEHLAVRLWRSGRTSFDLADVEQRMLEFLAGRPDLELHYPVRAPKLWKEDLRTATFLVRRDDDTFGFAHTSLREYFLARHLDRALGLPPEQARAGWQLAVPSPETLDFLGQLLAGHDSARRADRLAALAAIAASAASAAQPPEDRADAAAVLAFAYSLAAARAGHPGGHPPAGRLLTGANLAGWRVDAGHHRLDLRGISLAGADLTGAVLRDVDLSDADLTATTLVRAEILDSSLRGADLSRADLTGTVLRHCDLSGVRWTGSTAHHTQALGCAQPPNPRGSGWQVAPTRTPRPPQAHLTSFTGHTGAVLAVGWSPEGSRVLTGGDDGSVRVWDVGSGRELLALTGHRGSVRAVGWSPEGSRVLTGGDDGSARVW
ncbi:NACHT domain-containing NTPase, partial [Frankia sp. AiPa1]|uniref:NACHT domain-containing protein n=1 Tax=Frankia sp. AiPa1 TaxID=573492 RepID=UPI00202B9CD5